MPSKAFESKSYTNILGFKARGILLLGPSEVALLRIASKSRRVTPISLRLLGLQAKQGP